MKETEFLLDFDKQANNTSNNLLYTVTPSDQSLNLDLNLAFNISTQNDINNGNSNDSRYGFLSNGSEERDLGLVFCNENGYVGSSIGLGFYDENNGNLNDYRYGIMSNDTRERNLGLGFCNETRNINGTGAIVLDLRFCNEYRENNGFGDYFDDYRYGIVSNGRIETVLGFEFGNRSNINIGPDEDMFMSDYFAGRRVNENNGSNGELYNGIRDGVLGFGLEIYYENRNVGHFEDNMDMDVGEYRRRESALTGRVGNGFDEEIQGVADNGLNILEDDNSRSGVQIGSQRHDLDGFDDHKDDSCCAFISGDPDGRVVGVLGAGYSNNYRHLGEFDNNMDDFEIMSANGRELSNVSRNLDNVEDDMADSVYGIMMTDMWEFSVSADEEIQDELGIVNQDENRNSNNVQARFVEANERAVSGMLFDNISFAAAFEELENTLWNPEDEYEMLVGQLENEVPNKPTSKTVVENLQMVIVTKCDVDHDKATCAICKDDIGIGEKVKLLPCSHRYHGGCIDEWLGIRNTCPVCRYEFPTDHDE